MGKDFRMGCLKSCKRLSVWILDVSVLVPMA